MGILKQDYRVMTKEGIKASPVQYWCYGGFQNFVTIPEGGKGAIVLLHGYSNQEARALAKLNGYAPDYVHEFLICNWNQRHQEARPSTIEEKMAAFPDWAKPVEEGGKPLEFWEALQHDTITADIITEHTDYDKFIAAFNRENEAAVVYEILKSHMYSFTFFEGATDC